MLFLQQYLHEHSSLYCFSATEQNFVAAATEKNLYFPFKGWNLRHRKIKGHQKVYKDPALNGDDFPEIRTVLKFWPSSSGSDAQKKHGATSLLNAVCKAILLARSYFKSISWPQRDF